MNLESDRYLWDQADTVVDDYAKKRTTDLFITIQDLIDGKKAANKDHKRVLCTEFNTWIDFVAQEKTGQYPHFRVLHNGTIEQYKPDDEPSSSQDFSNPFNPYGNI
ncbi:hypothetical protein C5B42_03845 [Candidatus Cerribacteria bacterium 'Amazon FNV 2010 28 9']|uniref:Uncharacterized protein n=1 Tax=Candidatus Cerribacteria bacterium 'Amazon FNV 2010 28 9' TaxID=2081795 RepID=A0A317JNG3_9BACT|nr:MAG: hypothetical protein C5B42_03845 [Candidatus Cerribacteria bacterium 'Amazon FNV 2010 28 9']